MKMTEQDIVNKYVPGGVIVTTIIGTGAYIVRTVLQNTTRKQAHVAREEKLSQQHREKIIKTIGGGLLGVTSDLTKK